MCIMLISLGVSAVGVIGVTEWEEAGVPGRNHRDRTVTHTLSRSPPGIESGAHW